jgi:DNA helicase-2/ATP-dependent DNA helicase PcrA
MKADNVVSPGPERAILFSLNLRQQEVVRHGEGPLLVLAGAGSGKTRAIAHRTASLISERGISPSSILCLTFTNKAAEEMRERIEALTQEAGSTRRCGMTVTTFHALGARILRAHSSLVHRTPRFSIYDAEESTKLVRQISQELDVSCSPEIVTEDIARLKNQFIFPKGDLTQAFEADDRYPLLLGEVYRRYEQRLARYDAVDFTDLLMKPLWFLKEHPAVLNRLRHQYRHLLIDEYQDTCPLQEQMIQLLAAPGFNLCAVGDDDQAIYAFRGADLNGILRFQERYPNAKIIRMEQNYRSTRSIIEAARRAIQANLRRHPKSIFTENPPGEPVEVVAFPSEQEEAAWIARKIGERIDRGAPPCEIAILCRVASLFRPLEKELSASHIPYLIVDGLTFWERREVKDIMAYLRLINNSEDYLSFQRIANTPPRRVGKKVLQRIDAKVKTGVSLIEALSETAPQCAGIGVLLELLSSLRGGGLPVGRLIESLLDATRYEAYLTKHFLSDHARRSANLMQMIDLAKKFDREQKGDLSEFLLQAGLQVTGDASEEKGEGVQLMTIHAAKGLEFSAVFVIGLEEGILPHARSRENTDEERRLFYVAITRAKERLFLSWAGCRTIQGRPVSNRRSTFIKSLLPNTAERCLSLLGERAPQIPGFSGTPQPSSPAIVCHSPLTEDSAV